MFVLVHSSPLSTLLRTIGIQKATSPRIRVLFWSTESAEHLHFAFYTMSHMPLSILKSAGVLHLRSTVPRTIVSALFFWRRLIQWLQEYISTKIKMFSRKNKYGLYKKKSEKRQGNHGYRLWVEGLPSTCKVLGSNPSAEKISITKGHGRKITSNWWK